MPAHVSTQQVDSHLEAFVAVLHRWQRQGLPGWPAGSLPCPVARTSLQWTEFFALPVAVDAWRRQPELEQRSEPDLGERARDLAWGLVEFLAAVQREDGTFDAGFCGDLCQPCNAAFALRPLSTAYMEWPAEDPARREHLADVLAKAANACVDGGMNTANHRWVAAGGLAHAARALDREDFAKAADEWTRASIDIDDDGVYSEGSPKYALVSNDAFLDLEELQGRSDLGELARRSMAYLRSVTLPDGELAAVGSARYDTDGSTDGYARAAWVYERLGEHDLADQALSRLWSKRSVPGLVVPCATPPLGRVSKAKLYPSVTSALTAEHLLRWRRAAHARPSEVQELHPTSETHALRTAGLFVYKCGDFAVAVGRGPNLFEVRAGGAVIEGARLLGHATGWNTLLPLAHHMEDNGVRIGLSTAPGTDSVRLPQFHRASPEERRPGNAVPALTGELRLHCGPGPQLRVEIEMTGVPRANGVLELSARPDQTLFDADGLVQATPYSAPPQARTVIAGHDAARLLIDHEGGSGHALQVTPYGYGVGDDLWAPSFHPRSICFGLNLPARMRLLFQRD